MDIVFIKALTFNTLIGVYGWEKDIQQKLLMDIDLYTDTTRAGVTDDLADALDYDAISTRLKEYVESHRFRLIERLAEECAHIILTEFSVSEVVLRLSKPGALLGTAASAGVKIRRKARRLVGRS